MKNFESLQLTLPFPPSVNAYWRNSTRTLLSARARMFRERACGDLLWQLRQNGRQHKTITIPVSVEISLSPPDRKKRDLDNFAKAALDALTHAGVWLDDSQVHELRLAWEAPVSGGRASVTIRAFAEKTE